MGADILSHMTGRGTNNSPKRLLVVMPTWLGDCVMATPTLRALRHAYPQAEITALIGQGVQPVLDALPSIDRTIASDEDHSGGTVRLARRLAREKFDLAVLLPNSFRIALLAKLAGIPRRVGYDRDGRALLLTDRLLPRRLPKSFVPVPAMRYYLGLAEYLGAPSDAGAMELATRPADDDRATDVLQAAGYDPTGSRPLVLLNPGGKFGTAKRWDTDRFAAVADRLAAEHGAAVAVTGSPDEREILAAIIDQAKSPVLDLPRAGLTLKLLKSAIKRADLLITNDTGPRHIAAALGTAVVTIFGPTDPAWTTLDFEKERYARVDVPCGPCQKKVCPLSGTAEERVCMKQVTVDMVFSLATDLLASLPAHRSI